MGGKHKYCPRRIRRKAERAPDDGDITDQCWIGVDRDGREKLRFGKNGGLVSGGIGASESSSRATSVGGEMESVFG